VPTYADHKRLAAGPTAASPSPSPRLEVEACGLFGRRSVPSSARLLPPLPSLPPLCVASASLWLSLWWWPLARRAREQRSHTKRSTCSLLAPGPGDRCAFRLTAPLFNSSHESRRSPRAEGNWRQDRFGKATGRRRRAQARRGIPSAAGSFSFLPKPKLAGGCKERQAAGGFPSPRLDEEDHPAQSIRRRHRGQQHSTEQELKGNHGYNQ